MMDSKLFSKAKDDLIIWSKFLGSTIFYGFIDGIINNPKNRHNSMVNWSYAALGNIGTDLSVSGIENVDFDNPQIFFSNHQSNVDIFILAAAIPIDFYWIYKKSLSQVPVIGYWLKKNGHIPIDRSNHSAAMESLIKATKMIRAGKNIVVFPEGQRSGSYKMKPFKKGVFHLAIESKVPIVPVIINNSWSIIKKNRMGINAQSISVEFLKPIDLSKATKDDLESIMEKVRNSIESRIIKP